MKRIFTLLFSIPLFANAQSLVDNFNYSVGAALTDNSWIVTAANTTNVVSVTSPGLTYTGYVGSGIGNAVTLANNGQDVYRDASGIISSGSAYTSFMINVTAAQATGDYFFALLPSTSLTNYTGRTFIKSSGTGFQIGVAKSTETAVYATATYNFNTTYVVVVKYNFATGGTTDDQISMYVFSSGIPSTEPVTPDAVTAATSADAAGISRVVLRQGSASNAPGLIVDGIRFADSWANAPLPVSVKSFNGSLINGKASLSWSTTNEINVNGFAIEKSKDGKNFNQIDFVAAKNTATNNYAFTDAVAATGTTYYRLKITDKDGSFKYSAVVALNAKQSISLDVFPNPVSSTAILSHTKANNGATIKVLTIEGKKVMQYNVETGATQSSVDVSKLTRGNYLVVFENAGTISSAKFIKQ